MIGLLSFVLRVALLAGFTFAFVVLFEHGPKGFAAGAPVEFGKLERFLISLKDRTSAPPAAEQSPSGPSAPGADAPPATPFPATN